ncbi:hypothetical protein HG536_0H00890 [Torulaspora globosa]|uniref:Uncharacterized protein n=1 Tax=Torulaspora globosa TaxID=48254 RepID=A0A7G3ZMH8_9SACH|nr:uncharacterized protein HG536_0H00890 [Torulaspora globosa]QLL34714.1 hypothetical protein HG536_0H00890 [Torulaspora globosa]
MVEKDQLLTILSKTSFFLNQNDLLSLAQTSRKLHDSLAIEKLYHNITVTRDPVRRSDFWFIDCGRSYLSGYRALKKSADQNDLFLYDRIERLLESRHLRHLRQLVIQDSVFQDRKTGDPLLRQLLDKVIDLDQVELLDIRDPLLFHEYKAKILNLSNLKSIRLIDIASIERTKSLAGLTSIEWALQYPSMPDKPLPSHVVEFLSNKLAKAELMFDNAETSSLLLISYLHSQGVKCSSLKSLKLNHVHGKNSHDRHLHQIEFGHLEEMVNLQTLQKLELGLSCENVGCGCVDDFLQDLAPRLQSLKELALIEKSTAVSTDHQAKEDWDIMINKFLLHIPDVGANLRKLSIRHQTPLNGLSDDSVHGNYFRRRTLYETVLPKLKSLQTLIAPTMLQSLSAYEVLVCDLLWNGCQCDYCGKVLPIFDQYIMNHQYYSKESGRYMDVIPTVFFAYAGDFLTHNSMDLVEWDLEAFNCCLFYRAWDLHGYEALHHFENYDCLFDESTFHPLSVVITHFFDSYMDSLVQILPSLRTALLSGIYYAVDNESHSYESVYS